MSDMQEREKLISEMLGVSNLPSPTDPAPFLSEDDEVIELNEDFDFDGFQVVRREFFSHLREPSVTFNNHKFYVNMACIAKFPTAEYVQVLINQETKIMALRPCGEGERDSFQWCRDKKGKRIPKQIVCKLFFAKIFNLMGWNPENRYKLLGRVIHSKGVYLLAFDLTATEVYEKAYSDGQSPKASKTATFPETWQNQFGMSYSEHKQSMQINVFDGYAVYAIKDTSNRPTYDFDESGTLNEKAGVQYDEK